MPAECLVSPAAHGYVSRHFGDSAITELWFSQASLSTRRVPNSVKYRRMEQEQAIEAFAALAQTTRMRIFRLLVRTGPSGLQVGEISRRLEIVPSTLSGHLLALRRAGLLTATRNRREIIYRANLAVVNDLIGFLLSDCCDGRLENCSEILSLLETGQARPLPERNVLE